jgi:hypothetical protein
VLQQFQIKGRYGGEWKERKQAEMRGKGVGSQKTGTGNLLESSKVKKKRTADE